MKKITMGGQTINLLGKEIELFSIAEDFSVLDLNMNKVSLSDFKDKKAIVITTFPSVDTGICAMQTNKFNKEIGKFNDDVALIIISNDLPFALARYCGANGINNAIVTSDYKDLDFSMKYGLLMKENRLIARSVLILDKDRKITYMQIADEIKAELDYEKAINALKKIV